MNTNRTFTIDAGTALGTIRLGVANLEATCAFYQQVVGLTLLGQAADIAQLGIGPEPILELESRPAGKQYPDKVGLFHLAFLFPNRPALGRWLNRYEEQHELRSSADHLYSEAVYINDPEGNVIELYCDRPRASWYDEAGEVKMGTLPLQIDSLRAGADTQPFSDESNSLPNGTVLGHIHLQCRNVVESMRFYHELLGFDSISLAESAGFVGAGGYHHHIGFNTFNSKGSELPPAGALGLIEYTIKLSNQSDFDGCLAHLNKSGNLFTSHKNEILLTDPSGIKIKLKTS